MLANKLISFDGHNKEVTPWVKVTKEQNVEKFLNNPMAIVVQKVKRKKAKLKPHSLSACI
jgi:hypothetical protein